MTDVHQWGKMNFYADHLWFVSDFCCVPRRNLFKFLLFFIHCCFCCGYLHCLRHRNKFLYHIVMLSWIVTFSCNMVLIQHSYCTLVIILFRPFASLFINLTMCIRALFPKSATTLCLVEQAFWRVPLFHRTSWCKFLWGNPCKAIETFYHWDFFLWDFCVSMHFHIMLRGKNLPSLGSKEFPADGPVWNLGFKTVSGIWRSPNVTGPPNLWVHVCLRDGPLRTDSAPLKISRVIHTIDFIL